MKFGSQKKLRTRFPAYWIVILVILLGFSVYELSRVIIPFETQNPLYHEVTVGEPVIGNWEYWGEDEEGYLRFYNSTRGNTALLPPSSHMFDADGTFVVLEHHSPSTLTFADPIEAVPIGWIAIGGVLVLLVGGVIFWRFRKMKSHWMRIKRRATYSWLKPKAELLTSVQLTSKQKRFRPRVAHKGNRRKWQ